MGKDRKGRMHGLLMMAVVCGMMTAKSYASPFVTDNAASDTTQCATHKGVWGGTARFTPSRQMVMDQYSRQWLHGKKVYTIAAELTHTAIPSDSDAISADFGYPTLSIGMSYDFNHGVTMHRYPSPSWGKAQEVDYMSRLGNALTLYGSFSRPLLRTRHWEIAYSLRTGLGFNAHRYNRQDAIDNELIGSNVTIFFGAAGTISYFFRPEWAITAGIEYHHHSNGALDRPNKGENAWGPTLGIVYAPAHSIILAQQRQQGPHERRAEEKGYWYADLSAGLGAKALLEDWMVTQFNTNPGEPDYRTEHFKLYPAFSLRASLMRRYARRWASGIGADIFYGTYHHHVRDIEQSGILTKGTSTISPWSVGLSAHHEVFYHRLSLAMSLGLYLYRHMGLQAKEIEKPYYESIGVRYSFLKRNNMYVGVNVNAHLTKADFTELTLGIRMR